MAAKQDNATRRMQLILKAGGQWLPPQTLAAFAGSKLTDDAMLGAVESTRKAIVAGFHAAGIKADDGWKQFTDDPVLQKRSSLALAVKRYVSGAIGPWPIKDTDVTHIQGQLQKQGFGTDLNATGAWSPGWDAAYHQWTNKLYTSQLAGKATGSISFGSALHYMSSVLPKEAANAIIGTAKSLPGAARQLAADVAGGLTFAGAAAVNTGRAIGTTAAGGVTDKGGIGYSDILQQAGNADLAANVATQNVLGGHTTREATRADITQHPIGRIAADVGTMLIVHDAMKLGAQASLAIGEGALKMGARDLTQAEAERAGGVITRTVGYRGLGANLAESSVDTAAERGPGAIAGGINRAADAIQRDTNLFNNIPGATKVGGWVGRLSDADGLYYKARTLAALPYRIPSVAQAGEALGTLGVEGAKARAVGAVTGGLGSDVFRGINREESGVLNTADDAIRNRLDFTVLGHHIQPSLDDVAFFLHGPTSGAEAASAKVGESVDDVRNGAIDMMGRVGFDGAIERATGTPTDDAVAHMGGVENFTTFWSNNIYGHAANWWADHHIDQAALDLASPETGPLTSLERMDLHRQLAHAARVDPATIEPAVRGLIAQDGGEELARRIRVDVDNSNLSAKDYMKGNGANWVDASKIVKQKLLPFFKPDSVNEHGFITDPAEVATLGLARSTSLTKQSAARLVDSLQAEFNGLETRAQAASEADVYDMNDLVDPATRAAAKANAPSFDEYNHLELKVRDLLHKEFNVDGLQMPHTLPEKIAKLDEFSKGLASDIHPAMIGGEIPREVTVAIRQLNAMGYKLVQGTDIGWLHAGENQLDLFDGALTTRRKLVEAVGLSPDNHGSLPIGTYRRSGIRNAINALVELGKVVLPDAWTPDTLLAYLERKGVVDNTPGGLFRAAANLHVPKAAIDEVKRIAVAEGRNIGTADARAEAINEMLRALQVRDIPRKRFIEALTNPVSFAEHDPEAQAIMAGDRLASDVAPFTVRQANELYRAVVKGSAAPKAYLLGMSRVDDLMRASMGFAGSGVAGRVVAGAGIGAASGAIAALKGDHPELSDVLDDALKGAAAGGVVAALSRERGGWAIANMPNRLVQLRNDLRFTLSPAFSFRRIAKTNVKLNLEGIAGTVDPLGAMEKAGTLAQDRARLRDVLPGFYNEVSDDADRYLRENDIFGFYNARNFEAYGLGEWARKNPEATIEEQRAFVRKTFEYGSSTAEGRTALERTTNFVFFPFSFDKTLYRNLGGYLLDRPAQQILLTKGLAEYNTFNQQHLDGKNPLAASWWDKHVPVLNEALRLNAFAHGLSAGELGGINRPLLNLFLPQSWSSSQDNLDTLHRFIPALQDFNRVKTEIGDQINILDTVGHNMLATLKHAPTSPGAPSPVAETRESQIEDGFAMQRVWYDSYAKILDYNTGRAKDAQYKFPADGNWGQFAGEPITKDNVNRIIAMKYPAFNPAGGAVIAVERKAAVKSYLLKLKGTTYGDYAQRIFDVAAKMETAMGHSTTSAAQAKEYTSEIRAAATWLAERDAEFYDLYNRNLRRAFGPLETVNR